MANSVTRTAGDGVASDGGIFEVPTQNASVDEKNSFEQKTDIDILAAPVSESDEAHVKDIHNTLEHEAPVIVTGADAALHLLPLRDDGDPALTFRSLFLATILSAFQAVMSQIYMVCRPGLRTSMAERY